jgi:hypothetical protein
MRHSMYLVAAAAFLAFPAAADAQRTEIERSTAVTVSGGAMNYDLEGGSGWAPMTALRVGVPVGRMFTAELGASAAWPRQDLGGLNGDNGTTALFLVAPEAQFQMTFPGTVVSPYLGVGGGLAIDRADRQDGTTLTDFSASAAGGVRMALAERLGGVAEVRVRGIGEDFDSRTAELTLGLSWRLKPSPHIF